MIHSPRAKSACLLTDADPAPVELVNAESDHPVLLLCEHAGMAIPRALKDLGLCAGDINSHIGLDIGAEALARGLAGRLGAPLIIQRYSRLVIDCNRPPNTPGSIPETSDGVVIPANGNISAVEAEQRRNEIFAPLDAALHGAFAQAPRRAAFSIHSYNLALRGGPERLWHAGFLSRADLRTAQGLLDAIAARDPQAVLAINEPYRIEDESDWFIPIHAEARNLRHTLVEVRNDLLRSPEDVSLWADHLAAAIDTVMGATP